MHVQLVYVQGCCVMQARVMDIHSKMGSSGSDTSGKTLCLRLALCTDATLAIDSGQFRRPRPPAPHIPARQGKRPGWPLPQPG
jgi:hypothetical protein